MKLYNILTSRACCCFTKSWITWYADCVKRWGNKKTEGRLVYNIRQQSPKEFWHQIDYSYCKANMGGQLECCLYSGQLLQYSVSFSLSQWSILRKPRTDVCVCVWGAELRRSVVFSMINAVHKRRRGQNIKLAYYSQWLQIQIKKIAQDAVRTARFYDDCLT